MSTKSGHTRIQDGNEYKIWKWLVLKFHDSGHLQIILQNVHLNKITECLKMTIFKIDGFFFSAETTFTTDDMYFI